MSVNSTESQWSPQSQWQHKFATRASEWQVDMISEMVVLDWFYIASDPKRICNRPFLTIASIEEARLETDGKRSNWWQWSKVKF
jgi:hypothetical protein